MFTLVSYLLTLEFPNFSGLSS